MHEKNSRPLPEPDVEPRKGEDGVLEHNTLLSPDGGDHAEELNGCWPSGLSVGWGLGPHSAAM
jgi:hypothetical protein